MKLEFCERGGRNRWIPARKRIGRAIGCCVPSGGSCVAVARPLLFASMRGMPVAHIALMFLLWGVALGRHQSWALAAGFGLYLAFSAFAYVRARVEPQRWLRVWRMASNVAVVALITVFVMFRVQ